MNITKQNTVAEIVSKKLGSDHVFSKYNIDFCCGGNLTLEEVCKSHNVSFEKIKQEIEALNHKITDTQNFDEQNITSLIEHLNTQYHQYITASIPQIMPLAAKVSEVHGASNNEVIEINTLLKGVEIVLNEMLNNSKSSLYPTIETILNLPNNVADVSTTQNEKLKRAIRKTEIAQHLIGDTFKEISKLSSNYIAPIEACNSYKFLYEKLHEFDHQLQKYLHFNKHIFIPRVLKIIE